MRFEFDWDPANAESNRRKHGVTFEDAIGVFGDPLALSRLDEESGQGEERWVAIGRNPALNLLLVVHTYIELFTGAGSDTHHFGSPPELPRSPPIWGRVIR